MAIRKRLDTLLHSFVYICLKNNLNLSPSLPVNSRLTKTYAFDFLVFAGLCV